MQQAPVVDMAGTCDLHIHPGPDIFVRIADDLGIAQMARNAGQRAILLKCHVENTASRAYHVQQLVPEVKIFGSIVLNWFVGGLNPVGVEAALRMGAKEVFMPTIHSQRHGEHYKVLGDYGKFSISGITYPVTGITGLDETGKLKKELRDICELVAQYDAILGTGHFNREETYALVRAAREAGVNKILITHPHDHFVRFNDDQLKELISMGAMLELCSGGVQPVPGYATIDMVANTIKNVGASSIIISSDAGAPRKPIPPECTRVYGNCLISKGISVEEFDVMTKRNPAYLVGLD
jgi:hypothetical protein